MKNNPIKTLQEKMESDIKTYGFTIHYVYGDPNGKFQGIGMSRMDIHTHGITQNFNHRELQIVLPIQPHQASRIFHAMVEQIKKGKTFQPNKTYQGVVKNHEVLILENPETEITPPNERGEKLPLRVILPDPKGILPTPENPQKATPAIYNKQVEFP